MATKSPSNKLRKMLRGKIRERIEARNLTRMEAGERVGLNKAQMSRLFDDQDIFSLDRLVDVASGLGLEVRMSAVRPYGSEIGRAHV